ncbi:unnamed protein product [Phaedon cochleariae]|uniref:Serine racemase n=1 Tax=Phaedon cochleariae TaxID=80249 RepID=A0A9N9S8E9_PHACE|nr:unnamed protein product [Phaedon cochleariae]
MKWARKLFLGVYLLLLVISKCCYNGNLEEDNNMADPFCNPDSPVRITFEEVTSAAYKIRSGIDYTPCIKSHLSSLTGMDIFLKKDFLQHTGSFKERGARYAMMMLTNEERRHGVVAASLGNHAQAVSYHGYQLGIPVTVVMPTIAPIMKIQKCREYNAKVIMEGKDMNEAIKRAGQLAKEHGWVYINGYDNPQVIAGQGTVGLEIMEQVKNIDAVIVPTGGGGLLAGVAVAIKTLDPSIKVIGVESERCASFANAIEHEAPTYTDIGGTLADGLAVPKIGYNAWITSRNLVDRMITVKEEWIAVAILRFIENEKCVVEGAGATGLAAILAGQLDEFKGKRVVLILSGGNIDTTILGRCLERGLAADGRLVKVKVTVSDRPGGISELCKIISSIGVSIKDVIHERAWMVSDVFSVEVKALEDIEDPFCTPASPVKVLFEDVVTAAERISDGIVKTPCNKSYRLTNLAIMDVYLKCDFQQRSGSFKERGARNFMLLMSPEQRAKGVVAASAGNHAQAVSYHGAQLGIPVTVVMPIISPIMKVQKCKEYGARVVVKGKDMGEAKKIGLNIAKRDGSLYLNGFDHPQVIAGQGSAALELLEQVGDVDAVVVPIGGGGLLAGVAVAVKGRNPNVKVIIPSLLSTIHRISMENPIQ